MKAYSLLYLSLCSLVTLYACQSSHTTQMEKKELKMLEDSQPKSEEEAFENFYTPSHEALINWVLTDTATFSHPFTQSIKRNTSPLLLQTTNACASIHGIRAKAEP